MVKLVEEERIKTYTIAELEKLENKNYRTIKAHKELYFPIMIFDSQSNFQFKSGSKSTPYMVRYVRLKDIKEFVKKNSGKNLSFI